MITIPQGKYQGKRLQELNKYALEEVLEMLKPFIECDKAIRAEQDRRKRGRENRPQAEVHETPEPPAQRTPEPPRTDGKVTALCPKCGHRQNVLVDAWKGGPTSKPRCDECRNLIYAADQTAMITSMGTVEFGDKPKSLKK